MYLSYFYSILAGGSVVLGIMGLYFVSRTWMIWRNMDKELIKARVFLNKKFLTKNCVYIFLSGALLIAHQFIDLLMHLNFLQQSTWLLALVEITKFGALVLLVALAYEWYKVFVPNKIILTE